MLRENELLQIKTLLKLNNLPYEDLVSSKVVFILKKEAQNIVGCIGIEKFDKDGLLRSFAVNTEHKNQGIGGNLLNELLVKSKNEGIEKLHLLTTTADNYFLKKGFVISERENAPNPILNSKEFSNICPANAVYMTKVV